MARKFSEGICFISGSIYKTLNGIYNTVICHTTFYTIIIDRRIITTAARHDEMKPVGIIMFKSKHPMLRHDNINVQRILIDNGRHELLARSAESPILCLGLYASQIEPWPKVKITSSCFRKRFLYSVNTSVKNRNH